MADVQVMQSVLPQAIQVLSVNRNRPSIQEVHTAGAALVQVLQFEAAVHSEQVSVAALPVPVVVLKDPSLQVVH